LDLDGTLTPNRGPGGLIRQNQPYPVWESLRLVNNKSIWVVITNQTLFARQKNPSIRDFFKYLGRWICLIKKFRLEALLVCHHHPQATSSKFRKECKFRKPSGLMISSYAEKSNLDLSKASMVGDRITDMIAANSAGITKSLLIYNSSMFEENHFGDYEISNFAFFSLLPSPDESFFYDRVNELI
jgi:D-glycero-D-manno-heptose 1,7-bisphosphate phosphatase